MKSEKQTTPRLDAHHRCDLPDPSLTKEGSLIDLTHGGLFEGIGGFSLAARWAGIKTVWMVENNKWCNKLLNKHFPEAEKHGDIKETRDLRTVDIITGGFPCQPFSVAGKRKGAEDDRALWPEMFRIIKESKPAWVIGENVTGIINMELDTVLSDLEGEGFEAIPFVIPACGINAWHRRNRVWILAYSEDNGRRRRSDRQRGTDKREFFEEEQEGREVRDKVAGCDGERVIADTISMAAGAISGGVFGKAGKTESEKDQREWLRAGFEHIYEILADSYGGGLKEQQQSGISQESEEGNFWRGSIECGSWWKAEPGVGRVVSRLSTKLDVHLRGGKIIEKVSILRCHTCAENLAERQRNEGADFQDAEILQFEMLRECNTCKLRLFNKIRKETSAKIISDNKRIKVRNMQSWWGEVEPTPQGRKYTEQSEEQHIDFVLQMPQIRGYEAEKEECSRVNRLKGLGNAIVPEIAYIFYMLIRQIEEQLAINNEE